MSPRGKKKKDIVSPQPDHQEENLLSLLDLKSMTMTNMSEVIFLAGIDEKSNELLENIKTIGKKYQDVTYTTIITCDDVLEMFTTFEYVGMPESIETPLKTIIKNIMSSLDNGLTLTPIMMAQLLKIKLIHLIYQNAMLYRERKLRIKTFEEELNILTKDCRHVELVRHEKGKQSMSRSEVFDVGQASKSRVSKVVVNEEARRSKSKVELQEMDSTDDLVFNDDVSKHINFFVFQGIVDPEILDCLCNKLNVSITAIAEINLGFSEAPGNSHDRMDIFWDKIQNYLYGVNRKEYFENTILMKYSNTNELDYETIFLDVVDMMKSVWNVKLRHLYYLRNSKIVHVKPIDSIISADCLNYYKKLLQNLPNELASESIVFSTLLQEITHHFGHNEVSKRNSIAEFLAKQLHGINAQEKNYSSIRTGNMIENQEQKISKLSSTDQFLSYDSNVLEQITKSYGANVGNVISNLTINVLKYSLPFHNLDSSCIADDIVHKHDRDPSSAVIKDDEEQRQHFMNVFLFGYFTENTGVPNDPDCEINKYLAVYSTLAFWKKCQVVVNTLSNKGVNIPTNLYRPPLASFVWREKLSSDVLIQEVVKAHEEYQYCQRKYCPETEKYLISFSDHLDEYGINVRVYDEFLPTPICLRDFCKYIVVKKSDWLLNNQPPKYYRSEDEIDCFKMATNIEDEEYRRLLSPNVNVEGDSKLEINNVKKNNISFEQVIRDIRHYPSNKNLDKECSKVPKEDQINVYDIGTYYLSVTGAVTTFVSHDGVKLTVDNTQFINEKPKCTVRLTCRKNDVILHAHPFFLKHSFNFHIKLHDDTIITCFIHEDKQMVKNNNVESTFQSNVMTEEPNISKIKQMIVNLKTVKVAPIGEHVVNQQFDVNHPGDISALDLGTIIGNLSNVNNTDFYKIDKGLKFITPSKSTTEIPLINLIDRLASPSTNNAAINAQSFSKRHTSRKSSETSEHSNPSMDFRITLPNGLLLTCIPAVDGKDQEIEVKQEFLRANETDEIYDEEFRLFTRNGFVLVKKTDGTIIILKSSGDQIVFEKPDSDDEIVAGSNLKSCHSLNKDDYRKKLINVLNKKYGDDTCSSSRRGNVRTKKGYIINNEIINMTKNFKIPYKKTSIIRFSGHKTCLEGNKITQKHLYFQSRECDYSTGEISFERSDGFRSIFDKFGRHSVQFSDGTVITTVLHVQKELVDGFVFLSLSTQYEHPKYITTGYDFDNCLTIELNNDVKLTRGQNNNGYNVTIERDIHLDIDVKNVHFTKTCKNCNRKYKCDVNIAPLVLKKIPLNDQFVEVKDSYDKKLLVNFAGNCQRNNDFIDRITNNCACNHVIDNIYRKLFVFDEKFSGEQLWSEQMVILEKNNIKKGGGQINEGVGLSGKTVLRFTRNHYRKLENRFLNTSLTNSLLLSKYKQKLEPKVEYYSYRILQEMVDADTIQELFVDLNNCLRENVTFQNFQSVVGGILESCSLIPNLMNDSPAELKQFHKKERNKKCKCSVVRRNMQKKISIWREECNKYKEILRKNYIPSYFNSQFCQIVNE